MIGLVQISFLLFSSSLQLAASITELCFYHNTTTEGVHIQCGDLLAAQHLTQYAEHTEIESIQMGLNTTLPVLDNGLFTTLTNLKSLIINNAKVEQIAPRAFYGLEHLQELSLYNNRISKIQLDTFTRLYILRVLNLGQNNINKLEDNVFSSLFQLENLVLRWNSIENITKATFSGLRGLLLLDLRGNKILSLQSDVFEDLYFLENLDLSFNALQELPPTLLSNQRGLLSFSIESNAVKDLPEKLFEETRNLQILDVSDNLLPYFRENILNRTVVENLKICRNKISELNVVSLLLHTQWLDEVHIDFNPWNCTSLENVVDEFQNSQIYFENGTEFYNTENVKGIACKN